MAALQAGNLDEAERSFKAVLRAQPRQIAALNLLGVVLMRLGKFSEAEAYLRRAARETRNSDATLYNYGLVLKALKRPVEALHQFTKAIAINSTVAETWNNRGTAFSDLDRHAEAINDFDTAIRLDPRHAAAFYNRGKSLVALKRFTEALSAFGAALALQPDLAESWSGRGEAYWRLGRYDEALADCDKALALRPDFAQAWLGRGNSLAKLKRFDDALAAYDKALASNPALAEAWVGQGNALASLRRWSDAAAAYSKALAMDPKSEFAWLGRGNVHFALGRHDEAFAAYDQALGLKSDMAEAWLGCANVFVAGDRLQDALTACDRALALQSDLAEAWLTRGNALAATRQHASAVEAYDRAIGLNPEIDYARGARLVAKLYTCDWCNIETEVAELLTLTREGKIVTDPFALLATPASAADQLQCAKRYMAERPALAPVGSGQSHAHDRIRLAYVSADFGEHPVAYLAAGLYERHDRARFEVNAISFGTDRSSAMRQRFERAFDRFIDVRDRSDVEVAGLMRDLEIDIAVDLMGHTRNCRLGILARRPAPVQVSYLGYLAAMGVNFIDYVVADRTALPFDQQDHFSERIVHLPDCFLVTDNKLVPTVQTPSRAQLGLPDQGFVFCSFNNAYKLSRPIFELWMRLLQAVEGSVLWLSEANKDMACNLQREAERCGIDQARIVFAPHMPLADHLARQQLADLFLDSTPYNAGATGAAALWAGLPVLTRLGETFVGRMAASMLHAVGLPELVVKSLAEYEALAVDIARDPERCAALKAKLAHNRQIYPLFDTARFVRHLEAAYSKMWQDHRAGRRPTAFAVEPTQ